MQVAEVVLEYPSSKRAVRVSDEGVEHVHKAGILDMEDNLVEDSLRMGLGSPGYCSALIRRHRKALIGDSAVIGSSDLVDL